MYLLARRQLGIFYENALNRMLHHNIVDAIRPVSCSVTGEFTPCGGMITSVEAYWSVAKSGKLRA
jgi:7-cyano-7-deazaguanine reductase